MTKLALAELCDVVSSTVSKWEKGDAEPRAAHVDRLSDLLKFDRMFFFRPPQRDSMELDFWRSQSQATLAARERAKSRLAWLKEVAAYVWGYYDTPKLNLPKVDVPENFEELDGDDIDRIADEVRQYWEIPEGPVSHVIRTCERNGIVVSRCDLLADKLDALSEFQTYPFIILSTRKASAVRSRYDAGHEIGHMVLHRRLTRRDLNNPSKFSRIEDQAHRFAGAFLLPAKNFVKELWSPSLQALREIKEEWGASIGCMLKRCLDLGLINEVQFRRLRIQMSKQHWNTREPLDDVLKPEQPRLLAQCFETLVSSGAKTRQQILRDLRLPSKEIEDICSLQPGFFEASDSKTDELNIISLSPSLPSGQSIPSYGDSSIIEFKFPREEA